VRVPINLASEPFRNDRPMLATAAALAAAMSLVLALLTWVAIGERAASADGRRRVERLQAELARIDEQERNTQGILRQAGNAEVFDRSVFINAIIQRKGVSWTRLFADLETVLPGNVRLISIRPEVTAYDLQLDMVIGAPTAEAAGRFFMQLEAAPQFGATTVKTMLPPSQNETLYRYRVSVNYAQKL
jgi:hypothetical protein